ncbi:sugar phosphate isomerase/epimerase family protein [Algoriphagus chordae]|uniref:Sugar phosphate isomerase/epimerase n=1 Tax=Algoriphagus chordae TaxID=237019 RepID=A0A2W7QF96_9BACT|nr:sugar phosphate isomerase/epimerase [Algoriphagus chordae]PZX46923.1 sugar phosphate isomerase/epimerase [Algoriphagus chordae]
MKRRSFLEKSSLGLAAGLIAPSLSFASAPKNSIKTLGLGLFTLPKQLSEDFEGTLKIVSELGYKELEFFGPFDFSAESAKQSWGAMAGMLGFSGSGYFGRSPKEMRMILDDLGLEATSMHLDWDTLTQNMDQVAESAHIVGQKHIGIAMIPQELRPDLDGYKKMADAFNKVGESAKKNGLTFHYHNHGYGHRELEGSIPFQVILDETDPDLVKMEMDIFWFSAAGADMIGYLKNNPGRFELFHLKDMSEQKQFANGGEDMQDIMGMFPYLADAGAGVLDICEIVDQAQKSGAKHFFLEKDMTTTPRETLESSYKYLTTLNGKC